MKIEFDKNGYVICEGVTLSLTREQVMDLQEIILFHLILPLIKLMFKLIMIGMVQRLMDGCKALLVIVIQVGRKQEK